MWSSVCGKEAKYRWGIIAESANQIVPSKFCRRYKNVVYYIHLTPFPLGVLKGGLGTRLRCADLELTVF